MAAALVTVAAALRTSTGASPPVGSCRAGAWTRLGTVPDGTGGPSQPRDLGLGGPFVGTHRGALIVAGGANFPVAAGRTLWSDATVKIFYDAIHVATVERGRRGSCAGLAWHAVAATLPEGRAYGAVASHRLGVFLLGGTDGVHASRDALLLRWDAQAGRLAMFRLPPLPAPSTDAGAAVIGDTLYLVAGSDGSDETADLFALDLTRLDEQNLPRAGGGIVALRPRVDERGRPVGAWARLPPIPMADRHSMARAKPMVAAQSDGHEVRLYVIGGQRTATTAEYPDTIGTGVAAGDPRVHLFDDVWAYAPGRAGAPGRWRRQGRVGVPGDEGGRAAGTAIAVGRTGILLVTSVKGDLQRRAFDELRTGWPGLPGHPGFRRRALFYDAKSRRWRLGPLAPLIADPLDGPAHPVSASAATTPATCLDGGIVLATGEVRPRVRSPAIWQIASSEGECGAAALRSKTTASSR